MNQTQPQPSLIENLRFFLRPYRAMVAGLIVLQVLAALVTAISVGAISPAVSEVLGTGTTLAQGRMMDAITGLVDLLPFQDRFVNVMGFFLLVTVLAESSAYAVGLLSNRLRSIAARDWTTKAYEKVLHADYQYFLDTKQGDIVHLVMVASYNMQTLFEIMTIVAIALQIIAVFGLLLSISVGLTLVTVFAGALAYGALLQLSRGVVVRLGEDQRRASARQVTVADESIRGIRFLKVFETVGRWRRAFREATAAYTRAAITQEAVRSAPGAVLNVGFIGAFGLGAFLARRYWAQDFVIYLPILAVFFQAFRQLLALMSSTGAAVMNVVGSLPYAHTLKQALQERNVYILNGFKKFDRFEHCIQFDHVSYAHKDREETLSDVCFTIERNQVTAIVGPSGAGKSTMVDLLLRLYDVRDGAIRVDNADLKEFDIETWRQAIGLVSQEPFVFNATIAENIAFGKEAATRDEVVRAAKLADAHEFILECEHGYDTIVGDRGMKLSGGQRQRIVLARALLRDPQILILDEATSSLDTRSEAFIQEALQNLKGRCTQVVVAHRLSTIQDADKIVVLGDGRVAEIGTHDALMQQRGLYYELYRRQQTGPVDRRSGLPSTDHRYAQNSIN